MVCWLNVGWASKVSAVGQLYQVGVSEISCEQFLSWQGLLRQLAVTCFEVSASLVLLCKTGNVEATLSLNT